MFINIITYLYNFPSIYIKLNENIKKENNKQLLLYIKKTVILYTIALKKDFLDLILINLLINLESHLLNT